MMTGWGGWVKAKEDDESTGRGRGNNRELKEQVDSADDRSCGEGREGE